MARTKPTDTQPPVQEPEEGTERQEPAAEETPLPVTTVPPVQFLEPAALTEEPTVLVKDGHEVATTHPTEVINLKARGYAVKGK